MGPVLDGLPAPDEGLDLGAPFLPLTALERRDGGRIVLGTAMPYALLASAYAFKSTDGRTIDEVGRWRWVGVDERLNNDPLLYASFGLAALSVLLPSSSDADGTWGDVRLDRVTVLALGLATTGVETQVLKAAFGRPRPNLRGRASRPSGHTSAAFASMAFASNVLRDFLRPEDEPALHLRILEEVATAVPYLLASYVALERVHARKHFLTDTLLGAAVGAFTMHAFYAWSFTRTEQGRPWLELASVGWDPERRGVTLALQGVF